MPVAADCASWMIFSTGHVLTLSYGTELANCLLSLFESKLIRCVIKELLFSLTFASKVDKNPMPNGKFLGCPAD